MDALAFLEKPGRTGKQPVYVVTGDEDFLKRRVLATLSNRLLNDDDPAFALSTYPGDKADFSTIRNELDTIPFVGNIRIVVVEQADPFVTRFRTNLEKYLIEPSSLGVLILEVKAWPATTKLAKQLPESVTLVCKAPAAYRLPAWCIQWAKVHYGKQLLQPAAELLVELVGTQMGVLDSELGKLAVFVGDQPAINATDVDQLVGRSRAANVFRILDAIGEGKPSEAFAVLAELEEKGEAPVAIIGALGAQLRRLAAAARLHQQGTALDEAMDEAGIPKWPQARESTRRQLKHLGWNRLDLLYDWLVEIDLGLKGGNPLPERLQLERLLARLARARSESKA